MYSPDISQHSPRLYQLGKHYGIPMTAVADRLITHGLANLEAVFEWQPEMGKACVAEVVARIEPTGPAQKSA
jgi:hypothetical protein